MVDTYSSIHQFAAVLPGVKVSGCQSKHNHYAQGHDDNIHRKVTSQPTAINLYGGVIQQEKTGASIAAEHCFNKVLHSMIWSDAALPQSPFFIKCIQNNDATLCVKALN